MSGTRQPGSLGMDAPFAGDAIPEDGTPRPIGMGGGKAAEITATKRDWDATKPVTKPAPKVTGKTVKEVRASLAKIEPEWGRGGGTLRVSLQSNGDGTVTAVVIARFYRVLPDWVDEEKAEPEARTRWANMIERLQKHEQRHMDIAVEAAEWLADTLVGLTTDEIQKTQDEAVEQMKNDHEALDADSDHGADPDHEYGGVVY